MGELTDREWLIIWIALERLKQAIQNRVWLGSPAQNENDVLEIEELRWTLERIRHPIVIDEGAAVEGRMGTT